MCLCLRQCVFSYFMQATQVRANNWPYVSASVCVSMCAGGSVLSSQGQVGGDKTPLQCGVLVNWFWLRAKSPHRHLFVFSARPEKRPLSLKPRTTHPIRCDLSQSLAKIQVWMCANTHNVCLPLYAFLSPLSHFHKHWIIFKTIMDALP